MTEENKTPTSEHQTDDPKVSAVIDHINELKKSAEIIFEDLTSRVNSLFTEIEKDRAELLAIQTTLVDKIETNNQIASQKLQENIEQFSQRIEDQIKSEKVAASQKLEEEISLTTKRISEALTDAKTSLNNALDSVKADQEHWKYEFSELQKKQIDSFDSQIQNQKESFSILEGKILSLLPEASAVGLSKAFADEKTARKAAMSLNLYISYGCALAISLIAASYYFWPDFFSPSFILASENKTYLPIIISFAKLATIELPLIWLAHFSAKKAHQNQRIYEEYAHKYAAAMTYAGLCKETRDNADLYGEGAVHNLADGFRDAVYKNPSAQIDKDVKVETPFDLAERLIKMLGKEESKNIIDKLSSPPNE